jgi:hypothetical protein
MRDQHDTRHGSVLPVRRQLHTAPRNQSLKTWLKLHTVRRVSGQYLAVPRELSRLPRRDHRLIFPTPEAGTYRAAVGARAQGAYVLAGAARSRRCPAPFWSAAVGCPDGPGHEATAIRAADEDAARLVAARNRSCWLAYGHSQAASGGSTWAALRSGSPWVPRLTTADNRTCDHERQRCFESA